MKRSLKVFAIVILGVVSFAASSCSKCQTCKLIASDGTVLLTKEVCDDKNAMDQSKNDCQADADALPGGGTCTCTVSYSF